jgi:hypothetical protein
VRTARSPFTEGTVVMLDLAGPLQAAIGAGNLRAYVQGQDELGTPPYQTKPHRAAYDAPSSLRQSKRRQGANDPNSFDADSDDACKQVEDVPRGPCIA